ncbi:MAG: site-specific DNA-methyltransferase [Lachnospiraceae bacterium]|nr:site-specific DNA-methyltransferase [Lachnospiraceae bacterium]
MELNNVYCGDCYELMRQLDSDTIDAIYMDPPFFTQETQKLSSKEGVEYSFTDSWENMDDYVAYTKTRLQECKRVLKRTGSIFVHCDRNASHYLKIALDEIFGVTNFQSEIVWSYRRWSNSKKGLLNNHQIIFFYSKTKDFKFNTIYTDYSETTNVDQILQDRVRDEKGKSKYKVDENGQVVMGQAKKGVPLSDVWEIPYLNPKAKERVGYPTQKPIILLEQIIKLVTDEDDIVLDPFMGSGTTLVASKLLNRKYLGFDITNDAVELTLERLESIIKTDSFLLKKGKQAYQNLDDDCMAIIKSIDAVPVQRNGGIDGFLREHIDEGTVAIRIQREDENLSDTVGKLIKAARSKKCSYMVVIRTHYDFIDIFDYNDIPNNLLIIDRYDLQIKKIAEKTKKRSRKTAAV